MNYKRILSVFLIFILTFGMCSTAFATDDVPEGYAAIYTAEDLNNIRNNLSGKYILMNDIDLSVYENWVPIGKNENPFNGILDGNSFTVKNINLSNVEGENPSVGLFGTAANSQIKDITVIGQINVDNDNGIRAGLICGEAYNSVITKCKAYGKVDVTTKAGVWVGGITGYLSTYSNTDEVKECKIEFCQNNASVTVNGVCGYDTNGINYFVGGIAGLSEGTISKSSNYGDINAIGSNGGYDYFYTLAGGICGNSDGEINNCYNVGNISSIGTKYVFAGGISGFWYQFEDIYNCYNIGQVKAEVKEATDKYNYSAVGGIIGVVESLVFPDSSDSFADYPASIRNCYYLDDVKNAFGENSPQDSINIKSLTGEEISKQSSFKGFDFENVWEMSATENRPVLQNEPSVIVIEIETKTGKPAKLKDIDKNNILSWSSSNEKIAVINDNGDVKGLSTGTTDIVLTMNDGTVIQCNVTVEFSLFWWLFNLLFGWLK
ncbi:MAG: Ig-like domain-containing protein [Clostridia bacterium]|nr:Ig-like domain-containing protein [Clostridia bacterium]